MKPLHLVSIWQMRRHDRQHCQLWPMHTFWFSDYLATESPNIAFIFYHRYICLHYMTISKRLNFPIWNYGFICCLFWLLTERVSVVHHLRSERLTALVPAAAETRIRSTCYVLRKRGQANRHQRGIWPKECTREANAEHLTRRHWTPNVLVVAVVGASSAAAIADAASRWHWLRGSVGTPRTS